MVEKIKKVAISLILPALLVGVGLATVVAPRASSLDLTLRGGASSGKSSEQADSLFGENGIFKKITTVALFLIGALSVLMLIYGGVRYTVSGGDKEAVTNAKNTILYAVVGIIVAILSYAAIEFVIGQFAS